MSNLLKETMQIMRENLLICSEICFVGLPDDDYACTWDEFVAMAKDITTKWILLDLEIHFKNNSKLIREIDMDGYDRGWRYLAPNKKSIRGYQKLTTLDYKEIGRQKAAVLKDQGLFYRKE